MHPGDSDDLRTEIGRPGVLLVGWLGGAPADSGLLTQALEAIQTRRSDARVRLFDASRNAAFAAEHGVDDLPAVTLYRDGGLLFSQIGALPPSLLEALIDAAAGLDMDELRRTVDGSGARLMLVIGPQGPTLTPSEGGAPDGGPPKAQ
jgi:thioredoxin 1